MTGPMLPHDITFDADGHLSDVALSALADGEDSIVPPEAHAHLGGCDRCSLGLADAATRSAEVGEALRPLAPRREAAPRAVPVRAIAAGLLIAALGALPRIAGPAPDARSLFSMLTEALPALALRLVLLLRDPGPELTPALSAASLAASLVLFAGALALAREARAVRPDGASQETLTP